MRQWQFLLRFSCQNGRIRLLSKDLQEFRLLQYFMFGLDITAQSFCTFSMPAAPDGGGASLSFLFFKAKMKKKSQFFGTVARSLTTFAENQRV